MRVSILSILLLLSVASVVAQNNFDVAGERADLWKFFADKHADIGDDYRKLQLYGQARAHYMRALEFNPDDRGARKGLGQRQRNGEWVEDEPLPEESPLVGKEMQKALEEGHKQRDDKYQDCARRASRAVDKAKKAGADDAARILAAEVLRYAPEDAKARKLRGHEKDGDDWAPAFAINWRQAGRDLLAKAGEGKELEGEDEQAKLIGTTFYRRESDHLVVRSSRDMARAKEMHRYGEAHMRRAMDILGIKEKPFGNLRYTLTHLDSEREYEAMLEKVLKLEGDELVLSKRTSGRAQREPWGFITRSDRDSAADDMLGNTLAVRVLDHRRGRNGSADWLKTGFSYLVTSQVIGLCGTTRYALKEVGQTGSSFETLPEFSKKSGTPGQLREVALNEVIRGRDYPMEKLVQVGVNDMTIEYAAKSFSLLEFLFLKYEAGTRKWLADAAPATDKRVAIIEKHLGKPVSELEAEWRQWVLLNY